MEAKILDENFFKNLHRHFINVMCCQSDSTALKKNNGLPIFHNFSAFIVEIMGAWYAISAGHIFRDVKNALGSGAKITHWQIDDSMRSSNPKQPHLIPLDIEKDVVFIFDEQSGFDYAGFVISEMYHSAMLAEGVEPIPSDLWKKQDIESFPLWILVGTPDEFLTNDNGKTITKRHVTVNLMKVTEMPDGFNSTKYIRHYAKINFDTVNEKEDGFSIVGMSGGPIFGLKPDLNDEDFEYRIIGIQSTWNKIDHVAFCPSKPFIDLLEKVHKMKVIV